VPVKIIIVIVGALAAIGAVIMVRSVLSDNAEATNPVVIEKTVEIPQSDVLVAVRALKVGEVIRRSDMAWVPQLDETLTDEQITKDLQPDAIEDFNGHIVRIPIFANEAVHSQKVVSRGDTGIVAALLSPGMRAVTMEISVESAAGGFILPDDRVDVILTQEVEVDSGNGIQEFTQTSVLLENVRVLAIDQGLTSGTNSSADIGSTATLELSQENAALITLSERRGRLSLYLRSMSDRIASGDEVVAYEEGLSAAAQDNVVIYRNGNRSQTNVSTGRE